LNVFSLKSNITGESFHDLKSLPEITGDLSVSFLRLFGCEGAWRYLKPHLPVSVVGRPRELSMRQVLNALLYVLKTGCQWRQLPREFPVWSAVYSYFYNGSCTGTWERLHHLLRSRLREKNGRHKHPAAGCLDSQSVQCTAVPGKRG
jgi:putative transposase